MQNIKQHIPKLRFPEFEGSWKKQQLNNYIRLLSGYAFKGDDISENEVGIPILRGINITEGKIRHSADIDRFYEKSINDLEKYLLKEGDLVLGMDGSKVGKNVALISKTDEGALLIQRVARLRARDTADIRFIFLNVFSERFHRYVDKVNTSSGIPHISSKQIKEFEIGFPSLKEQQKIASFLTAVDTKISQFTKKKELLEQYKKGVMQKLFSQELRFKDDAGKDYPEWEEKRLGKITKYYDGTHQTPNYVSEGIPFYSVEHVTANQFQKTKYISEEVFDKENKRVKLEKGDILMTRIGNVGKAKYIDWNVKASFYVSLALIKQGSSFSSKYLAQYINAEPFQRELWKRIIHVAFPIKINLGEIGNCIVQLPCREEQIKIANFMSAIDEKIEAVNTQIEKTTTFKKGLLQQLFV